MQSYSMFWLDLMEDFWEVRCYSLHAKTWRLCAERGLGDALAGGRLGCCGMSAGCGGSFGVCACPPRPGGRALGPALAAA
eukprot:scaffold287421_cov20-Prasinocladus_malaysianus.AAC.1